MTTLIKIKEIPDDYLSVAEVAAMRRVDIKTVYRWMQMGMPHIRDPYGRLFIAQGDAKSFTPKRPGWPKGGKRTPSRKATQRRRDRKKRIAALRAKDMTIKDIAAEVGVSVSTVWFDLNGKK